MLITKLPAEFMREHDGSDHCTINNLIDDAGYDGGDHYITHGLLPGAVNQTRTVRQRKKRNARLIKKRCSTSDRQSLTYLPHKGQQNFFCDFYKIAWEFHRHWG